MGIKYQIEATEYETLDSASKDNYIEEDGKYILALDGDDVKKTMKALAKERELNKQREKELAELKKTLNKLPKLDSDDDSIVLDKNHDEIISKRVKAKTYELETQLSTTKTELAEKLSQLEKLKAHRKEVLLTEKLSELIGKHQEVEPSSIKVLKKLGAMELEYDEDRDVFKNETHESLDEWVNAQLAEYPTMIKPSFSAGASGGKKGIKTVPTLKDQITNMFKQ